jgi:hypothetical protein
MGLHRGSVVLLAAGLAAVGCAAPAPVCGPDRGEGQARRDAFVRAMDVFLDGLHAYADQTGQPVQVRHVCGKVNEELHTCVVYDADGGDDDLLGVELVISERLFRELPEEDKPFWHSHRRGDSRSRAISSGGDADLQERLASTYGRLWYPDEMEREDVGRFGGPRR